MGMTFDEALDEINKGKSVARKGWGDGKTIGYVDGEIAVDGCTINTFIGFVNAEGQSEPWPATAEDEAATDWLVA